MTKDIGNKINFTLFIIALFFNLMININPPVWKGYADPYDYLKQSKESIFSKEMYFPKKCDNFFPRPFTVPLLYKIANSDPDKIILMQRFLHTIATFFLCYVVMLFLKTNYSKIIFCLFWYLLMSWWNIVGWTNTLLSESISISLMFIWIGSFLIVIYKKTNFNIIFHLLITILFSFTRDSWPYILIIFYTLNILYFLRFDKKLISINICFLLLSIGVFYIQQKSAIIGQRYRLPVMNNIVFRILPNNEYLKWFTDRGMPSSNELQKKYSNLPDWKMIYPLYNDTCFSEFSDWVIKDGKSTYTKFLITHPSNFFLLNEKKENLNKIFAYNINYTGNINGYCEYSEKIFPFFNLLSIILLNIILLFIFYKEKLFICLFPAILIIIFTLNAILLYIADTLEVERHLFITNISIQFIGILSIVLIFDSKTFQSIFNKITDKIKIKTLLIKLGIEKKKLFN